MQNKLEKPLAYELIIILKIARLNKVQIELSYNGFYTQYLYSSQRDVETAMC